VHARLRFGDERQAAGGAKVAFDDLDVVLDREILHVERTLQRRLSEMNVTGATVMCSALATRAEICFTRLMVST
jgi:hypothetical protein